MLFGISGAILVTSLSCGIRCMGFFLALLGNITWIFTAITISNVCILTLFSVYFICNIKGIGNNINRDKIMNFLEMKKIRLKSIISA
ncbi:hypothetical protein F1737_09295 [Methanoplanus sp. FWC-SCC4]|uniref:Uncharacterized protein n=1 Tax=Methanochimaera problematica TaxID=2609417 RepID=A0AA97FF30_9EURY|nr:hypothetical protein [Methanoplanus sp. FWC-SCC4]WOF16868.1 hypothetical protein F1737_09295 [Methanoplanus sp. FWC-SCC4]